MSMRDFLDGACGQLNPVLKVASHFTQDLSLRESLAAGIGIGAAATAAAAVVSGSSKSSSIPQQSHVLQHNAPPTTFQMESLLHEVQSIDPASQLQHQWTQEFTDYDQSLNAQASNWVGDFVAGPHLESAWNPMGNQGQTQAPIVPLSQHPTIVAPPHQPIHMIGPVHSSSIVSPQEFLDESKWVNQYNDPTLKTELMTTAEDLLNSVKDPKIKATEFMKYVEKLSTGEVELKGQEMKPQDLAEQWANDYEYSFNPNTNAQEWADQFSGQDQARDVFWQKMNDEWERLAADEAAAHPWLSEPSVTNQTYNFNESNPFQDLVDPFTEGKRRLAQGDIPSAVLAFESAVQKFPENAEAWLYLGTTQAQNEQDPMAIAALNKCLQLQPDNMDAMISLAASLTNESYHLQACSTLMNWLKMNSKYSQFVKDTSLFSDAALKISSVLSNEQLSSVQKGFIAAARLNPKLGIDPDVQSGLGILFNLGNDYEKAADCFKAALSAKPNDSLLWNRLGATLANGGKSAEAISAYRRALELSPGFIRTRYNLGISCVNLTAYKEAAEHFLSALNQQASGKSVSGSSTTKPNMMSDSIWTSLRMILHLMDRADLIPAINSRDLTKLNREFNIS